MMSSVFGTAMMASANSQQQQPQQPQPPNLMTPQQQQQLQMQQIYQTNNSNVIYGTEGGGGGGGSSTYGFSAAPETGNKLSINVINVVNENMQTATGTIAATETSAAAVEVPSSQAAKYHQENIYSDTADNMSDRGLVNRHANKSLHQQQQPHHHHQYNKKSDSKLMYDQQSLSSQQSASRRYFVNGNGVGESSQMQQQQQQRSSSRHNNNEHNNYRQTSKRSVNFDQIQQQQQQQLQHNQSHIHGDSVEGSVMVDEHGQIIVRDNQNQNQIYNNKHSSSGGNNYRRGGGADAEDGGDDDVKSQRIQVQILPQDDNWGENTTAFNGDFSDFNDDMTEDGRSSHFNPRAYGGGGGGSLNGKEDIFSSNNSHSTSKSKHCAKKLFGLLNFYMNRYFSFLCGLCVSTCAFITPILFIVLPRLNLNQQWQIAECGLECEGLLIGIAFKMFILLLGAWAIFFRRPKAILPRIYELRALIMFILCVMTFSFWLFYGVRIIDSHTADYYKILQFTVSYVDVLLFVFIISVFILELRHLQPQYVIKIVRSPDGEQRQYTIGSMSIQRAAIWILEQYYKDFGVYNPWLENAHRKRLLNNQQQQLAIEQQGGANASMSRRRNAAAAETSMASRKMSSSRVAGSTAGGGTGGGNMSASDRFYEEYEFERRLRKRRARLITSTEDAFTHIRRMQADMESMNTTSNNGNGNASSHASSTTTNNNNSSPTLMDPYEAAQAIFTSIARDLRRYLRVTRQQPYFTRDSIIAHLANCISYDMSPKSFLQRYLNPEPLVFNERALVSATSEQQMKLSAIMPHTATGVNYNLNLKTLDQTWILICDTVLYQNVEDNLMFVLKQNEVSLMCTFKRLPYFNLIEDILDPKRNKFVLKLNSETTV